MGEVPQNCRRCLNVVSSMKAATVIKPSIIIFEDGAINEGTNIQTFYPSAPTLPGEGRAFLEIQILVWN